MCDSFPISNLDRTLKGLADSLLWTERALLENTKEVEHNKEEIIRLTALILEVEKAIEILRKN